ncbi:unnamed protein product [Vitrella brassicaformis CCMP3155]|uniref:Pre-mRNA-splicing factor 18 n=1 Tax=Vitrella brassicaformis (strain CCMP3155) TaxID=1169540 RepID=A0A0G4G3K0_VITBC|nr:unnamed protein product [Vitrella brassicaformis CCMP3155]|eukprot:CEM22859.1 unnamed protein product [Vitrella brassicaformis CCMP3155]
MDAIRALISQKKKETADLKTQGKQWISQADVRRRRDAEKQREREEEERKERERTEERLKRFSEYLDRKKKDDEHEEEDVLSRHVHEHNEGAADDEGDPGMDKSEVFYRLRRFGEPVTLFGETDMKRWKRLHRLELERHDDDLMGGQRHAYLSLEKRGFSRDEDDEDDHDDHHNTSPSKAKDTSPDKSKGDAADGDRKRKAEGGDSDSDEDKDGEGGRKSKRQRGEAADPGKKDKEDENAPGYKEEKLRQWIKKILREWDKELVQRPEEEKKTSDGKIATMQHRDTRQNLKPLTKKLKQRGLDPDVLEKLYEIACLCEERKYVQAHDLYIQLAIGNAAWPMGVTMVGIHERAGRSKIFTSQVAHILNDETTRKYIQMVKRLMSFCQRHFPTDPSNMVRIATNTV